MVDSARNWFYNFASSAREMELPRTPAAGALVSVAPCLLKNKSSLPGRKARAKDPQHPKILGSRTKEPQTPAVATSRRRGSTNPESYAPAQL